MKIQLLAYLLLSSLVGVAFLLFPKAAYANVEIESILNCLEFGSSKSLQISSNLDSQTFYYIKAKLGVNGGDMNGAKTKIPETEDSWLTENNWPASTQFPTFETSLEGESNPTYSFDFKARTDNEKA